MCARIAGAEESRETMFDKLNFITDKYKELALKTSDPEVIANQSVWQKYIKEMGEIEPIVKKYEEYKKVKESIDDAKEMLEEAGSDEEMKELAKMELTEQEGKIPGLEEELKVLWKKQKDMACYAEYICLKMALKNKLRAIKESTHLRHLFRKSVLRRLLYIFPKTTIPRL